MPAARLQTKLIKAAKVKFADEPRRLKRVVKRLERDRIERKRAYDRKRSTFPHRIASRVATVKRRKDVWNATRREKRAENPELYREKRRTIRAKNPELYNRHNREWGAKNSNWVASYRIKKYAELRANNIESWRELAAGNPGFITNWDRWGKDLVELNRQEIWRNSKPWKHSVSLPICFERAWLAYPYFFPSKSDPTSDLWLSIEEPNPTLRSPGEVKYVLKLDSPNRFQGIRRALGQLSTTALRFGRFIVAPHKKPLIVMANLPPEDVSIKMTGRGNMFIRNFGGDFFPEHRFIYLYSEDPSLYFQAHPNNWIDDPDGKDAVTFTPDDPKPYTLIKLLSGEL